MTDFAGPAFATFTTAVVAAFVTFVFTNANEFIRARREHKRRWDRDIFDRVLALIAAAGQMYHQSGEGRATPGELDALHGVVRVEGAKLRVVCNREVAAQIRLIRRHSYSAMIQATTGIDPRPDEMSPRSRLLTAIDALSNEARAEFGLNPLNSSKASEAD